MVTTVVKNMINSRLAVAIHILSLISTDERASSDMIAGSVNTNPVVVRRTISQLKKAGILTSRAGVPGASLKKDPSEIALLEVYRAVQNKEELLRFTTIRTPTVRSAKIFSARSMRRSEAYSGQWRMNLRASPFMM